MQKAHCTSGTGTGRIPSIKMGRRVLIDLEDMDKIIGKHESELCNKDEEIVIKLLETFMVIDYNAGDNDIQTQSGLVRGGKYV